MDEKLKAFWAKINQDMKDIWNQNKVFFIVFSVLILVVKFRDVLIDLLVSGGKREFENAKKEDNQLANQENSAKEQADALVKKSSEESANQQPIGDDWNKK